MRAVLPVTLFLVIFLCQTAAAQDHKSFAVNLKETSIFVNVWRRRRMPTMTCIAACMMRMLLILVRTDT